MKRIKQSSEKECSRWVHIPGITGYRPHTFTRRTLSWLSHFPSVLLSHVYSFLDTKCHFRLARTSHHIERVGQLPSSSPVSLLWPRIRRLRRFDILPTSVFTLHPKSIIVREYKTPNDYSYDPHTHRIHNIGVDPYRLLHDVREVSRTYPLLLQLEVCGQCDENELFRICRSFTQLRTLAITSVDLNNNHVIVTNLPRSIKYLYVALLLCTDNHSDTKLMFYRDVVSHLSELQHVCFKSERLSKSDIYELSRGPNLKSIEYQSIEVSEDEICTFRQACEFREQSSSS